MPEKSLKDIKRIDVILYANANISSKKYITTGFSQFSRWPSPGFSFFNFQKVLQVKTAIYAKGVANCTKK